MSFRPKERVLTEFPSELGLGEQHPPDTASNYCQSEQLARQSDDGLSETRRRNLFLLLIRVQLEELGFRRYSYERYLPRDVDQLSFRGVQNAVSVIIEKVLEELHNPE